MRLLLSFTILLLTSLNLSANSDVLSYEWKQNRKAKTRTDVATFISKVPNSNAKAFRALVYYPYSTTQVTKLIHSVPLIPLWAYNCKLAERPYADNPESTYLVFKGKWPAKDRDVLTSYKESYDAVKKIKHMHIVNINGVHPEQKKRVRIPKLDNHWFFTAAEDGGTHVEFITFVDIGGGVPKWLANMVAKDAPYDTLNNLGKLLKSTYGAPKIAANTAK